MLDIQYGSSSSLQLLQLKDTVIADPCEILLDKFEVMHALEDGLFLVESGLLYTCVDFLLEDELEVIVGEGLLVADEVEVVEGTDQVDPELLKLTVYAVLDVAQSHVQLDVVEFVEIEHLEGVDVDPGL